jgi:hypothetical protein
MEEDYKQIKTKIIRRYEKLREEIIVTQNLLDSVCPHPKTSIKETYVEGGYLNREEFIKTLTCDVCDKQLDQKVTLGGYC